MWLLFLVILTGEGQYTRAQSTDFGPFEEFEECQELALHLANPVSDSTPNEKLIHTFCLRAGSDPVEGPVPQGELQMPTDFVMHTEGTHLIDLPLRSEDTSRRIFGLDGFSSIEWWFIDEAHVASMENPTFELFSGNPGRGAQYDLRFGVRNPNRYQSGRWSLRNTMGIVDLTTFDENYHRLSYYPRFTLFEWTCDNEYVDQSHIRAEETDPLLLQDHNAWKHQLQAEFDQIHYVRISFQNHHHAHFQWCPVAR